MSKYINIELIRSEFEALTEEQFVEKFKELAGKFFIKQLVKTTKTNEKELLEVSELMAKIAVIGMIAKERGEE